MEYAPYRHQGSSESPVVSITTNYTALFAQRSLGRAQSSVDKSLERLASGLRINRAADDPAGLAMATAMSAKTRSNSQALRNINDGISLTSIAEGALQETDNLLIRMRELAVQALNGTLSSDDRQDVQDELSALQSQLDTVAKGTSFNGLNLLDKSRQDISIQTGTGSVDTVDVVLRGARALDLGQGGSTSISGGIRVTADLTGSTAGMISINGQMINPTPDGGSTSFGAGSARALADAITSLGIKNLTAAPSSGSISMGVPSATRVWNAVTHQWDTNPVNGSFVINGQGIAFSWNSGMSADLASTIVDAINNSNSGVHASDNGGIFIESSAPGGGYNIQIQSDGTNAQSVFSGFNLKQKNDLTVIGSITINSERAFNIEGGLQAASQGWDITPGTYCTLSSLESIDIALNQVSEYRAILGSTQNRLESEARNVQNQFENLSMAQSRIMDADLAQETAELTKNTILKQAGIAILSQANQLPSIALSLLRAL